MREWAFSWRHGRFSVPSRRPNRKFPACPSPGHRHAQSAKYQAKDPPSASIRDEMLAGSRDCLGEGTRSYPAELTEVLFTNNRQLFYICDAFRRPDVSTPVNLSGVPREQKENIHCEIEHLGWLNRYHADASGRSCPDSHSRGASSQPMPAPNCRRAGAQNPGTL